MQSHRTSSHPTMSVFQPAATPITRYNRQKPLSTSDIDSATEHD